VPVSTSILNNPSPRSSRPPTTIQSPSGDQAAVACPPAPSRSILGLAMKERHTPQFGGRVGHGRHDSPAVVTGGYGGVVSEPDRDAARLFALDVERSQPRPRPILRARHVQHGSHIERRDEIQLDAAFGQSLQRFARGSNSQHVHRFRGHGYAVQCMLAGFVDGRLGTLAGALGPKKFAEACTDSVLP
jgi:hypothetical protein